MINGKTIVITGVASEIGKRTAELASVMQADVIGIDVNEPRIFRASFSKAIFQQQLVWPQLLLLCQNALTACAHSEVDS